MFFLKNHVEKVKIENIKSNEVYAPVEGEVIPLDEVDDAVFSEKNTWRRKWLWNRIREKSILR